MVSNFFRSFNFGFGGVPYHISRDQKRFHHTNCSRTVSILLLLLFIACATDVIYSWITNTDIYISKKALLFPRKVDLPTFTNEILSYINLRAEILKPNASLPINWCVSMSTLMADISPSSVAISHANCTTFSLNLPVDQCTLMGIIHYYEGRKQFVTTHQDCTLFNENYSSSSSIGVVRLRLKADFPSNIKLNVSWNTAKIVESIDGFQEQQYSRIMSEPQSPSYIRRVDVYVQKYVMRKYDWFIGTIYEDTVVYNANVVIGGFEYVPVWQSYGSVTIRLYVQDDYFVRSIKPTTLFVIFSRIGGMASVLSIVVFLLRQYNQNNLNDTQPGIDFNELQYLIHDQSSRRKMEIVSYEMDYVGDLNISLAGGAIYKQNKPIAYSDD